MKAERFTAEWWESRTMPEPNTGCWLWLGTTVPGGYGRIRVDGVFVAAHRASYASAFGLFDPASKVCHRCDTPACVNPDHLFLGTQKDNVRDMMNKGRSRRPLPLKKTVATEALPSVAPSKMRASVEVVEDIHHIRTSAMVSSWRHVIGLPPTRDTSASDDVVCPDLGTAKPSSDRDQGLPSVATAAPLCAPLGESRGWR